MKLLINFNSANQYFDLESKHVYHFNSLRPTAGIYCVINNIISALFTSENILFFLWSDIKYPIHNSVYVKLEDVGKNEKKFKLFDSSNLIIDFIYDFENFSDISPFEYLDNDDGDWGLFVANIINNKLKKQAFIESRQ